MKKITFILLLALLSIQAYSQRKGDLTVGAKGGFVYSPVDLKYDGVLYGIDVAYSLSDPFEIVFTGMMNSNIPRVNVIPDKIDPKILHREKEILSAYSTNLDFRLYLINQREWGIGPALGGQYYIVNVKGKQSTNPTNDHHKAFGFNIGIHGRANLTDNLILNGGWRYTNAKEKASKIYPDLKFDMSYNLFYLGVAYTFELK